MFQISAKVLGARRGRSNLAWSNILPFSGQEETVLSKTTQITAAKRGTQVLTLCIRNFTQNCLRQCLLNIHHIEDEVFHSSQKITKSFKAKKESAQAEV